MKGTVYQLSIFLTPGLKSTSGGILPPLVWSEAVEGPVEPGTQNYAYLSS